MLIPPGDTSICRNAVDAHVTAGTVASPPVPKPYGRGGEKKPNQRQKISEINVGSANGI